MRLLSMAIVVVIGCLGAFTLAAAPPSGFDVTADGIQPEDVATRLPGIARPARLATLSTAIDGVLMELAVGEGKRVEKNAVLATLDNRIAVAEVKLAEAAARRKATADIANYEIKRTQFVLERLLALSGSSVSRLEVEEASSSHQQAIARLEEIREQDQQALLRLKLAKARLESYNVRAPFSGVILRVEASIGESISGDDELLQIADLTTLRVQLRVPVQWFGKLETNRTYHLAASHPVSRVVPAKLVSFEPIVDSATQTFRCVFEIDNQKEELPAGFSVLLLDPAKEFALR